MKIMKRLQTLEETIPLMLSEDPEDRFIAEYSQLMLRIESLCRHIQQLESTPTTIPDPRIEQMDTQLSNMLSYLTSLTVRSVNEGILLPFDRNREE